MYNTSPVSKEIFSIFL